MTTEEQIHIKATEVVRELETKMVANQLVVMGFGSIQTDTVFIKMTGDGSYWEIKRTTPR